MWRVRKKTAVAAVLCAAFGSVAGAPLASAGGAPAAAAGAAARGGVLAAGGVRAAAGGSVTEVTLITGERVRVVTRPGGRQSAVLDQRSARPGVGYIEQTVPGPDGRPDLMVLPSDAAGLVSSGELDQNLFDVSELVRDGYGDAARATLPLIVTYRGATAATGQAAAVAARPLTVGGGAVISETLPSIRGVAVAESKAGAARFWSALTRRQSGGGAVLTLAPQVAKVWLDEPVRAAGSAPAASAAASAAAPVTRAAAATGAGVLVADLDTGYDATHPDLKGVVAASADFTGSKDGVRDDNGHGTWTASIIAGSGAASSGKYHGVAPGARLLIGKVLNDLGEGTDSQIIAGMQWAVAHHAKVVNMSLGGQANWMCPAGIDPLSQAVNSLSASSGALFVVAAGNDGQATDTVESPGVAASALTVGAVDSAGKLAFFSSRGPDCGDAVKPDITALGVGVVGATAAGTVLCPFDGIPGDGPVNAHYTRCSGTSASAPYVSGAAAVLAQEHPGWSGAQLKAALMASARPAAGTGVYDQGDGQADLARATSQDTYATPSSEAFVSAWPHVRPATRTVTYHDAGTTPVTLNLAVAMSGPAGKPAPAGLVTVSPARVTVAPGADASVRVSVHPAAAGTGLYGGYLTATSTDGSTVTHTAIAADNQPKLETVTFTTIGRDGRVQTDTSLSEPVIGLINLANGALISPVVNRAGTVTASVTPGRYDITTVVNTNAAGKNQPSMTLIDVPSVTVTRDMTVTLDARRGRPVAPALDRHVGNAWSSAELLKTIAGIQYLSFAVSLPGDPAVYAAPTGRVTGRPYDFYGDFWADNSAQTADHLATVTYSVQSPGAQQIPALPTRVHDSSFAVYRPDFRQWGKPMTEIDEIHLSLDPVQLLFLQVDGATGSEFFPPAAGTVTEYLTPGAWRTTTLDLYGPVHAINPGIAWSESGPVSVYRAGHVYTDVWGSAALSTASVTTRSGDVITPDIQPDSTSAPGHVGDLTNGLTNLPGTITLRKGSTVIGSKSITSQPTFTVPAGAARYTLSATAHLNVSWSALGTQAQASWTFTSGHVPGTAATVLPLWDVRVSGPFNVLDQAPAGKPFPLVIAPDLAPGAPRAKITAITVSASYNDGKTWHRLTLRAAGPGRWTTTVTPPKGTAFVSLSDTLTDAAGNTASQTTIRAYEIRP